MRMAYFGLCDCFYAIVHEVYSNSTQESNGHHCCLQQASWMYNLDAMQLMSSRCNQPINSPLTWWLDWVLATHKQPEYYSSWCIKTSCGKQHTCSQLLSADWEPAPMQKCEKALCMRQDALYEPQSAGLTIDTHCIIALTAVQQVAL